MLVNVSRLDVALRKADSAPAGDGFPDRYVALKLMGIPAKLCVNSISKTGAEAVDVSDVLTRTEFAGMEERPSNSDCSSLADVE